MCVFERSGSEIHQQPQPFVSRNILNKFLMEGVRVRVIDGLIGV